MPVSNPPANSLPSRSAARKLPYVGPVVSEGGSGAQELCGAQRKAAVPLKNKRAAILAYIVHYQAEAGYPPTILEIAGALGMSKTGVHYHLEVMEAAGIIERKGHSARAMRIL